MKKLLIFYFLTAFTFSGNAFAKETLYLVNTASTSGSYNAALTAYAQDLENTFNIEYVQAKGCVKSEQVINKIISNGGQAIALFYSEWLEKPECVALAPTAQNTIYTNIKAGIIFGRIDEDKPLLTDGATIAFNNEQDGTLNEIASANNINYKLVRYENSKAVVLAVMNRETDFGIVGSPKYFWKNSDKFRGLVNLSDSTSSDIPSVLTVGGTPKILQDTWVYHGNNYDQVRNAMKTIFLNPESVIAKWQASIKGYQHTFDMTGEEAFNKYY